MLLWCRGCKYRCVTCGGNNWALGREKLAVRDPEAMAQEIVVTQSYTPHHVGIPGRRADGRLASAVPALKSKPLRRAPGWSCSPRPTRSFLRQVVALGPKPEISLSPESHDETVRRAYGRPFTNEALEQNIGFFLGEAELFVSSSWWGCRSRPRNPCARPWITVASCSTASPPTRRTSISLSPCSLPSSTPAPRPSARRRSTDIVSSPTPSPIIARPCDKLHWREVLGYETAGMTRAEIGDLAVEAAEGLCALRQEFGSLKPEHAAEFMRLLKADE